MSIRKPTETDLVRVVLDRLSLAGVLCWRNNSGALKVGRRIVRFGHPGSGDVFAVLPTNNPENDVGQFVSIECKVGKNKPTVLQEEWARAVRAAGGVAVVVRSIQELEEELGL
jgi:hypothetical protein